jgi:hypothetical protein
MSLLSFSIHLLSLNGTIISFKIVSIVLFKRLMKIQFYKFRKLNFIKPYKHTMAAEYSTKSLHRIDEVDDKTVFLIPPVDGDKFYHDPRRLVIKNGEIVAISDFKHCIITCKCCCQDFRLTDFLSIGNINPQRSYVENPHKIFTDDDIAKANLSKELKKLPLIKYHADQVKDLHDPDCGKMCCHCCFSMQQLRDFYRVLE